MHLTRIDELSATIEELSARIDQEMRPFAPQIERLVTIPGVQKTTAEVIIAETGADMTRFRTPANLASWAGVCPGPTNPPASNARVNAGTATDGSAAP
jgi:transposase